MNSVDSVCPAAVSPLHSLLLWLLAPSFNTGSIETDVASPYLQEIAQGALATLQMMAGVWSDPGLAAANKALFNQRVATVAMHFARGQGAARVFSSRTYC